MKLDEKHPDYERFAPDWQFLTDAICGERAIKEHGRHYLPETPGMLSAKHITYTEGNSPYRIDYDRRAQDRYFNYKLRAEFPEKVAPACDVAVGLMTDRPATFSAPDSLLVIQERATADADTLEDLHRQVASLVCGYGRCGLWVDVWPDGSAPYLIAYEPQTIINWHETTIAGEKVLDKLVIQQEAEYAGDLIDELLIYTLEEVGVVLRRFVREKAKRKRDDTDYIEVEAEQPRTARQAGAAIQNSEGGVGGFRLPRIPFQFVNATSTRPAISRAPFLALATQCLKAYRMDANYQEAMSFYEPTPVITGITFDWIEQGLSPTSFGAGALWLLPEGADAKMLEYTGPSIQNLRQGIEDALQRADEYAKAPFERNITQVESGEAKRQRARTQTSAVKIIAQNVGSGIEKALRMGAAWVGFNPLDVSFVPNLEFVDMAMDAQEILAMSAMHDSGKISARTLHERFKKAGITELTYEEEQAEIEAGSSVDVTDVA